MQHQSIFVYCFQRSLQISLTVAQKIFLTPHIQSWWQTDVSQRCQTGLESKSLVGTSDVSRPQSFGFDFNLAQWKLAAIYTVYLVVIVLPTNCLTNWKTLNTSQPLYISECNTSQPLWTHLSLSSVQILAFFQYKSPYQTTRYYKQLFLSGLFGACTFYLELSTCTHSFYRHPIHL